MTSIKETEAFKKLFKIAKNGTFGLYATTKDNYYRMARSWPVAWEKELGQGQFKNKEDRQRALNKTLESFVEADFPSSVKQMKKEREMVGLILEVGADPNYYSEAYNQNIFDAFLGKRKSHIALEIAKADGFAKPGNVDQTFNFLADALTFYLQWNRPYPGATQEETIVKAQNCQDRKELVCNLFQKNIYPHDRDVFVKLIPVVLEKDPDFVEKKKQQVIAQLIQAKTPVQFFNALMGKSKEKE